MEAGTETADMPADKGVWVYTRDIVEAKRILCSAKPKVSVLYNTG